MKGVAMAVRFSIGLVVLLGLPVAGWGLGDWRGFLADPVRVGYVVVTALACAVAAILNPPSERKIGDESKLVRRQHLAIVLLQALSVALLVAAPRGDRSGVAALGGPATRPVGLLLYGLGLALMNWAPLALGRHFSLEVTIQEGHRLVTHGPYRFVRHPRYLGILLFTLGIALVFRSGIGLVLWGGFVLVLVWRVGDEEALLRREFGAEWDAYVRRSWRMVPFVF